MNTWTNEFGDRIMAIGTSYGMAEYQSYVSTNKDVDQTDRFKSLQSAKAWLNKFRRAKVWTSSKE